MSSGPARSASRVQRAFYIQARGESGQLTVLVEKEQVALLATEAVAFLDRIADQYPEAPISLPESAAALREPTVPLFRARLIGLGFDPERELVLLELREHSSDDDDESEIGEALGESSGEEDEGYVARLYATPAAGAGDGGARRCGRHRRPSAVPAVRHADGPRRTPVPPLELTPAEITAVLADGELEVVGRMRYSSNGTFLVQARADGVEMGAIYKPRRGERPLWDFPDGTLCKREVAVVRGVASALGWDIVPITVLREDGPLGIGAVQRFVEHDPDEHYFTLLDDHEDRFRQFAVFDVLVNNTDRKGGHCLHDLANELVLGIDHGLTFHPMWKLRTVIWDFAGEPVPPALADDVCRVLGGARRR